MGRVLVTGATGFIGSALCRRLAARGSEAVGVSRTGGAGFAFLPDTTDSSAFASLVGQVDHIVHCAGIAHTAGHDEDAYLRANRDLTAALAKAAAPRLPGRFVYLSSIRAVCGPSSDLVIDDETIPAPTDAYGRSKLAGEGALRNAFSARGGAVILRPALVYGREAKGNFAMLRRLARSRLPLPFAGLDAPRSMVALDSLVDAVMHLLEQDSRPAAAFAVADRNALGVAGIISAMRKGLGRPPGLFRVPPAQLRATMALTGRNGLWDRLAEPLRVDSSALAGTGWTPVQDTSDAIARLMAPEVEGGSS